MTNKGYDPAEIQEVRKLALEAGKLFVENDDELQRPELRHFLFVGKHEGQEVIFDAVAYTLEMLYVSNLYEIAEERAAEEFPNYKPWELVMDDEGNMAPDQEIDPEIEEFKASVILELEADDDYKVSEKLEFLTDFDFGVGLEVALNVPEVTDEVINDFITKFNAGTLKLDENLYSFEVPDADEDDY